MKKVSIIQYVCLACGSIVWIYGWKSHSFNILAVGILLLFIQNILFAFREVKERIIFLLFQGALFTFLLARPIIGMFEGIEWWTTSSQAEENVRFSLLIVTLSLVALYLGAVCASFWQFKLKEKGSVKKRFFDEETISVLKFIALFMFLVTTGLHFLQESEKLIFIYGKTYLDYYSQFQSSLPGWIHTLADFMPYSLCIYLATFPTKKQTIIPLIIYWCSAIPSLLIGVRNPIVLNSIFIFLYYFIREILDNKERWLKRAEKILLVMSVPCMIIFMFLYASIRSGRKVEFTNPFIMIKKFFWAQGVTFDFVAMGYGHRRNLPDHPYKNYTFGGIIDYITHGQMGQILFGTSGFPDGNNLITARESNSLAHNLSYVILKDRYLNGQGVGSSYLLENYLDFGYIGVVLFSLVLGGLLIFGMYWMKKNILLRTIVLVSLTSIFFMPRAEATGWLTFIVTLQFWLCVALCFCGSIICTKVPFFREILLKIRIIK